MAVSVDKMSDEELVSFCIDDIQFLPVIIHRYESKLFSYISRKSNATKEDIEDILQEVFIKVYKNLRDFDKNLKFSSWIYRITHNEMINWYRKTKNHNTLSLDDNEHIYSTLFSEIDLYRDAIDEEMKININKTLKELPDKYKEIVELRFFEDKSYEEIADILCIPIGTVSVRINRVKDKLRNILNKNKIYE